MGKFSSILFLLCVTLLSGSCGSGGGGGGGRGGGNTQTQPLVSPNAALVSGPLILSEPPTAILAGKHLQYQVQVESSEPSTLQLSLTTSPIGLTLDSSTGLMTWTPKISQVGDQAVTINAKDSVGQTSQSFTLSVFGSQQVASALITASGGGVITVNDPASSINGLNISIPPGALTADTTFSVSELIIPPTIGGTTHFFQKGFSIEPDGTLLSVPATVTLPYSASEFNNTTEGIPLEEFIGGYYLNTSTGIINGLENVAVDTANHVITAAIPHFSVWVFDNIARLCPPYQTTESDCAGPNIAYTPPATQSVTMPTILVHGFQPPSSFVGAVTFAPGLGKEATWGNLRTLLGAVDGGKEGRIDAWRFDWDSLHTKFEKSGANLATAIHFVSVSNGNKPVNLLAHSFGGIVVRTYLQNAARVKDNDPFNPTSPIQYNKDVNKVMTLGTPHRGIGGDLATVADYCASLPMSITCLETNTGTPTAIGGGGGFLNNLNNVTLSTLQSLPSLRSTDSPQYDIVIGNSLQQESVLDCTGTVVPGCISTRTGVILLNQDDGLITKKGANLCGDPTTYLAPLIACSYSSSSVLTETPVASASNTQGLCHSDGLCDMTVNIPMANVLDKTHPLWQKICEFLGGDPTKCQPNLKVTLSDPAGGTVTSDDSNQLINCGSTCTAAYPPNGTKPQTITLTVSNVATGYTFTGWSGDCASDGAVTMTQDKSCAANFTTDTSYYVGIATFNITENDNAGTHIMEMTYPTCDRGVLDITTSFAATIDIGFGAPVQAGGLFSGTYTFNSTTAMITYPVKYCYLPPNASIDYFSGNPRMHFDQNSQGKARFMFYPATDPVARPECNSFDPETGTTAANLACLNQPVELGSVSDILTGMSTSNISSAILQFDDPLFFNSFLNQIYTYLAGRDGTYFNFDSIGFQNPWVVNSTNLSASINVGGSETGCDACAPPFANVIYGTINFSLTKQ
jgi:uncharacterized repeat protein (TIGR02543 family)